MSTAGEWSTQGIAFRQVAIAREDLVAVNASIRIGDSAAAIDTITATIRQLEAARRMLRGF